MFAHITIVVSSGLRVNGFRFYLDSTTFAEVHTDIARSFTKKFNRSFTNSLDTCYPLLTAKLKILLVFMIVLLLLIVYCVDTAERASDYLQP